jgi:hypothetical protein
MTQEVKIYIEGLERSGNVFLNACLRFSFNCVIVSKRDHEINGIKDYSGNHPFIVPVRDALPSIVSSKIYRDYVFQNSLYGNLRGDDTEITTIIKRYKEYTTFLLNNPKFFIAPFHEFTKDHNGFLDVLMSQYPHLPRYGNMTKDELFKKIDTLEIIKENLGHPELGNLPREDSLEKEKIKEEILLHHSHEIEEIQKTIEILYARYYEYKKVSYPWYYKSMTQIAIRCCEACTCSMDHKSEPPTDSE